MNTMHFTNSFIPKHSMSLRKNTNTNTIEACTRLEERVAEFATKTDENFNKLFSMLRQCKKQSADQASRPMSKMMVRSLSTSKISTCQSRRKSHVTSQSDETASRCYGRILSAGREGGCS